MVAGERRTWRMLEADVEFRCSCEGRSEGFGVGLFGVRQRRILSVDKATGSKDGYRYEAAMCVLNVLCQQ